MTRFPIIPFRWRLVAWTATAAIILSASSALAARSTTATPEQVDAAVDKAIAFLLSKQEPDGSWEPGGTKVGKNGRDKYWVYFGGETAAATYALLAAGVNPQTPALKKAIAWLESNEAHGTYVVGLRSGVWSMLPEHWHSSDSAFAAVRDHDRDFALYSRILNGPHKGFYGYTYGDAKSGPESAAAKPGAFPPYDKRGPVEGAPTDHSNSQYGVFAAWGTEEAGAEVPAQYWVDEDAAWKAVQMPDGGWEYRDGKGGKEQGSTYTMTCAGLATLFITQDYIFRSNSHQFDVGKGGVTNANIQKGLAWLDTHISDAIAGGRRSYYGLYGIERVGVASGRKYFGDVDWYKTGSSFLVGSQAADGGWGQVHDTCFATVFLCRGRAPVIMNKLLYETASKKPDPWNERPRDAANLARWMSKHALESFLNWQIVDLKQPADELHDAPILYIAGSEEPAFSEEEIAKLRLYVEQGGMIVGNADGGSSAFENGFKKLGATLFPNYKFRRLPIGHPIFSEQFLATKWNSVPTLDGLSNGVRELMLLIPGADVGRAWQAEATRLRQDTFELGDDIFLYASGKENLERKGSTYIVNPTGLAKGEIKIARLQVGANWDPEPGAWRRMAAVIQNTYHVEVKTEPVKLGGGLLAAYKIADLTGTTAIVLSPTERTELKSFIASGGTLIIDAAGGSGVFAESIETELTQIFGDAAIKGLAEPLPPEHVLFTEGTFKIEQIKFRMYARQRLTGSVQAPHIRAIATANGRLGVFYSREDLTAGAVGEPVDGIVGYEPKTATQLLSNIVMYADLGGKAPATQPTARSPKWPSQKPHKQRPTTEPTTRP